jgi:hypothetical protein
LDNIKVALKEVVCEDIVRFQLLAAASMKMEPPVLRVVAPCRLTEYYRRFRGACYLHHRSDDNPEDSHLQDINWFERA